MPHEIRAVGEQVSQVKSRHRTVLGRIVNVSSPYNLAILMSFGASVSLNLVLQRRLLVFVMYSL